MVKGSRGGTVQPIIWSDMEHLSPCLSLICGLFGLRIQYHHYCSTTINQLFVDIFYIGVSCDGVISSMIFQSPGQPSSESHIR